MGGQERRQRTMLVVINPKQRIVDLRRFVPGSCAQLTLCTLLLLLCSTTLLWARQSVPLVGDHIGNVPFTTGLAADQPLQLEVIMALNNRAQLDQFENDLQNRDSPSYHKWLTPQQFADTFGPTPQQMQTVVNWLGSQGLLVTGSNRLTRTIQVTGAYSEVQAAFKTTILTDGVNYGNVNDPQVPVQLAPLIVSIEGLHTYGPPAQGATDVFVSGCTEPAGCGKNAYFGPSDFYSFYDVVSVLQSGNLGTGSTDCVGLPEFGNFNPAGLTMFTSQFASALPSPQTMPIVNYSIASTITPAPPLPSDYEPALDIEWVHAVSPNTPIRIYFANGPLNYFGAIQQAVAEDMCGAISSSVEGPCDPVTTIQALDDVEAQAAIQGQSIFKSSGDYGDQWYCGSPVPTYLTQASPNQLPYAQYNCPGLPNASQNYQDANFDVWQPSIDEEAAGANITVVGGTQFQPSYAPSPSGANQSTVGQNLEVAWNGMATSSSSASSGKENCPQKDATGGGPSVIFSKPSWQMGVTPNDGARDIPDVALGASSLDPGFFVAGQKIPQGSTTPGPLTWVAVGGTSIATPMWAGISRLIAQAQGVNRLGNINNRLYELGTLQNQPGQTGNFGLHDITLGGNTNNGVPGYSAAKGYDLVTGWGSPDVAKLIAAFPGAAATITPVNSFSVPGQSAAAGSFTINNTTAGALELNSVTVKLSAPSVFSSLTLTATVGGTSQATSAIPAASSVFNFSPPVVIPAGGTAMMGLQGLTGTNVASIQSPMMAGLGGRGGQQPGGSNRFLWFTGLVAVLVFIWAIVPGRRTAYLLTASMLFGIMFAAASCGSSGGGGSFIASQQSIGAGGIGMGDGGGGQVQVSGLPATLGTVTVQRGD
jgi:subtilase family serine protease